MRNPHVYMHLFHWRNLITCVVENRQPEWSVTYGRNVRSKSSSLPPTDQRVSQPVTCQDRPIIAVIQLLFKFRGRIPDLGPMISCIFNLCDVHMRTAITCIVPMGYLGGPL